LAVDGNNHLGRSLCPNRFRDPGLAELTRIEGRVLE
jgi:hypothetical protein